MSINKLIGQYKEIEDYIWLTLDDIINKVTQEVCELIEAHEKWDIEEQYKEAGDVIVNVLSTLHWLWIDVDLQYKPKLVSGEQLAILLWQWNSTVQWLRKRYSRETINTYDVRVKTQELISRILTLTDPNMTIEDIIKRNTEKFESRKDLYIRED